MDTARFNRPATSVAIALGLYFLLMIVIEKIGIDQYFADLATLIFAGGLILIPSFSGGAIRSNKFFFANRDVSSNLNAFAITSNALLPFFVIGSGYYFFNLPSTFVLLSVSILISLAIFSLLLARPFRQSGATSTANYLTNRFQSPAVARAMAIVNFVAGSLLFLAGLKAASQVGTWFFSVSELQIAIWVCCLIVIVTCLGGVASLSYQGAIATICFLIALNIPLALEAFDQTSIPVGLVSFITSALSPVLEIETQLRQEGYQLIEQSVPNNSVIANWTSQNWHIAAILIALGMVASPNLLQQFSTNRFPERSSNSGQKSVLVFALISLSIFALLAFLKLSIYEDLLGLTTFEVRQQAPYLIGIENSPKQLANGLISICGEFARTHQSLLDACGGDPNHVITLNEVQIDSGLLLAASAFLMDYPYALTGFLGISIMMIIIAFCASVMMSISSNFTSAYFTSRKQNLASAEIFLTRFTILLFTIALFFVFRFFTFDSTLIALFGFGIYAACLLPSLIAAFYFKNTSIVGSVLSICVGFLLTIGAFILSQYGVDFTPNTGDELSTFSIGGISIEPVLVGILVLPISSLVLILFSLRKAQNDAEETSDFNKAIFSYDAEQVTISRNRF